LSASKPGDDNTLHDDLSFEDMTAPERGDGPEAYVERTAADLEAVFDVPVRISVVLGRTKMPVSALLRLDTGTVIELDRQVGEAVEIFINERLVARGEIVLVENKLGVTMTEIIKPQ
jgi:flagellar motor switch protein FliN/FliY